MCLSIFKHLSRIARYQVDPIRAAVLGPSHGVQDIVCQQIWQLYVLRHDTLRSLDEIKDLSRASGLGTYGKIAAASQAEVNQR